MAKNTEQKEVALSDQEERLELRKDLERFIRLAGRAFSDDRNKISRNAETIMILVSQIHRIEERLERLERLEKERERKDKRKKQLDQVKDVDLSTGFAKLITRRMLEQAFNMTELRSLVYETSGVLVSDDCSWEQLNRGLNKPELCIEIVECFARHGKFWHFVDECRNARPHLSWPEKDTGDLVEVDWLGKQ